MWPTQFLNAGSSSQQTHPASRTIPNAQGSPLPGPIRRSVRALPKAPPWNPIDSSVSVKPRSKSLWGSFTSLSPNTRIIIGLAFAVIGLGGLYADRQVLPTSDEDIKREREKLISVRTVDKPS